MNLQRAISSDLEEFLGLMQQFYQYFDYPFTYLDKKKVVEHFFSKDYLGSIWLMQLEGKSVGYLALTYGFTFEFGGRDAFVDELFVSEPYRNKGFGRLALLTIQEKMTELGLVAVHLQTESYNERAKKLYESLNFRDLKRSTLTFLRP